MSITVHQVTNTDRTSPNGQVTALADRKWYDFLIGSQIGIIEGCTVSTVSGLQVSVASGWGIIEGCIFTISADTITVVGSQSGGVPGRLLLELDTATSSGIFVSQAGVTSPPVQENINTSGTKYQLILATYTVNETTVSNLVSATPAVNSLYSLIQGLSSSKQDAITGGASTIVSSNLTSSRALISNGSGKVAVSAVTATELGYLDGVTSAVQTQLNAKVPTSRTVNGHALSANVTVTKSDIGLGNVSNVTQCPASRTVNGHALTSDVTVTKSDVSLGNVDNVKQMPIAGGTFTGAAMAYDGNANYYCIRNILVQNSAGTSAISTGRIIMRRK